MSFTAGVCLQALLGLLLRRGGGQEKSQERRGLYVQVTVSQSSRRAALAWGLYGPGLSYLLLAHVSEVSWACKEGRLQMAKNLFWSIFKVIGCVNVSVRHWMPSEWMGHSLQWRNKQPRGQYTEATFLPLLYNNPFPVPSCFIIYSVYCFVETESGASDKAFPRPRIPSDHKVGFWQLSHSQFVFLVRKARRIDQKRKGLWIAQSV